MVSRSWGGGAWIGLPAIPVDWDAIRTVLTDIGGAAIEWTATQPKEPTGWASHLPPVMVLGILDAWRTHR